MAEAPGPTGVSAVPPLRTVFWLAGMLTAGVGVRPSLASVGVSWPSAHGACSSARGPVTFSFPVRSCQRGSALLLASLLLLAAGLVLPRPALALTACTAADIIRQDSPSCPATGACVIDKAFNVGDGCTLDFGTRAVTLAARGDLDIASGSVGLIAGSLVLAPGATITGRGTLPTPPRDHGGMLMITTTGAVAI